MKNNFNKFMSLLLSLLMVGNVMTLVSFATGNEKTDYQKYSNNLTEENRLLYLDNFDLTDGKTYEVRDGENIAVTEQNLDDASKARSSVSGDDIYCKLEKNEWYYAGVETTLPLSETTEYTIEFYAKKHLNHGVGFGWSNPKGTGRYRQGIRTLDNQGTDANTQIRAIGQSGTGWGATYSVETTDGTTATRNLTYNATNLYKDDDGYVRYVITVKGRVASLYMGENCELVLADINFSKYDLGTTLSLFCMNYTNETDASGVAFTGSGNDKAISIKDISVYDVIYESTFTINAKTGDLILELDNLDLEDGTTFTSNYDVNVTRSTWSNADHDGTNSTTVSGNVISSTRTTNNWYMAGVETTLPLDANSKYTIEFYVKELMPHALGLAWSNPNQVQAKDKQGFLMMDRGGANKGYDTNVWALDGGWGESKLEKEDGTEYHAWPGYNVTTKHKDAEGFVRYTITIDGNKVSLYVGGQLIVENAVFDIAQAENLHLGIHNWTAESKGQYGGEDAPTHKSGAETTPGAAVEVKNIRVWQGHTVRPNMVYAVLLDGTRQALFYGEDNMITEFPDAGGEVAEDEIVIWTYSNNNVANVVAIAPFEVTADVTFTAKKIKTSDNTIVGMQYTTPTENKQNVRFISTIHSLKGSAVGFEITARYMKNGALTEKSWDESSGSVYTSIKATTPSGTVKDTSARDLGGTYLFAISVDEVLTNIGQIDFYVRSYVVVNGEKVYDSDKATVFSMNNGVYTSDATPLQNNAS